ncbi:MAG TPA: methylated-DNA--[protein]-cysteine S-methyltransferase [Nitrospirota bacterium]|nr:methylated-DNA--[protein]-cysteine S-methyltransferase [Nitrospirota bacterium]
MTYTCTIDTPLGVMTAAATDEALSGLWFVGQKYYPPQAAHWVYEPNRPIFKELRHFLASYFSGKAGAPCIPLAPKGSPFRKAVWDILVKIPKGHVASYGQIAALIGETRGSASMSAQAVGGAVGHNPISILIPCHRVVGHNGSLTGYAGGLDKKAALLRIEKVDLARADFDQSVLPFTTVRRAK